MYVNIQGRNALIPGLNKRTPQYNVNLSEADVRRLVNFRDLRLSDAHTGKLIMVQNVNEFFTKEESIVETTEPVVETPKEIEAVVEESVPDVVEQEPVLETYETPQVEIIEETVDVAVEIEEPAMEVTPERVSFTFVADEPEEETITEDAVEEVVSERIGNVEEIVTEEEPKHYTKRNKKKKRNS